MRFTLKNDISLIIIAVSAFLLCSCHSTKQSIKNVDMVELARAGMRLGFNIEYDDDWNLMMESANWLGTPYKFGGTTKSGVDCSGLNLNIYNKVYGITLERKSIDQYKEDCKRIKKRKLKSGDLVFFAIADKVKANNINHTGIYLKDGKFLHASSSRGVVVDELNSDYFQKYWVSGGRVKK